MSVMGAHLHIGRRDGLCGLRWNHKDPSSTPTGNAPIGSTVTLGQSAFLETTISFSAGQALRLVDPAATGGVHQLCPRQRWAM